MKISYLRLLLFCLLLYFSDTILFFTFFVAIIAFFANFSFFIEFMANFNNFCEWAHTFTFLTLLLCFRISVDSTIITMVILLLVLWNYSIDFLHSNLEHRLVTVYLIDFFYCSICFSISLLSLIFWFETILLHRTYQYLFRLYETILYCVVTMLFFALWLAIFLFFFWMLRLMTYFWISFSCLLMKSTNKQVACLFFMLSWNSQNEIKWKLVLIIAGLLYEKW